MAKDKDRIIALQKQLKIARETLTRIQFNDTRGDAAASDALERMNQIEWASRPSPAITD